MVCFLAVRAVGVFMQRDKPALFHVSETEGVILCLTQNLLILGNSQASGQQQCQGLLWLFSLLTVSRQRLLTEAKILLVCLLLPLHTGIASGPAALTSTQTP